VAPSATLRPVPSPHRRVGVIVDEPVDSVLHLFRETVEPTVSESRIARMAVLDGAMFAAIIKLASGHGAQRERAADLVTRMKAMLPALPLDRQVKNELLESLERVDPRPSLAERRRRQLALLSDVKQPELGQTAQDIAEMFDAFERHPAQ
jgi:hypothetical protein